MTTITYSEMMTKFDLTGVENANRVDSRYTDDNGVETGTRGWIERRKEIDGYQAVYAKLYECKLVSNPEAATAKPVRADDYDSCGIDENMWDKNLTLFNSDQLPEFILTLPEGVSLVDDEGAPLDRPIWGLKWLRRSSKSSPWIICLTIKCLRLVVPICGKTKSKITR